MQHWLDLQIHWTHWSHARAEERGSEPISIANILLDRKHLAPGSSDLVSLHFSIAEILITANINAMTGELNDLP